MSKAEKMFKELGFILKDVGNLNGGRYMKYVNPRTGQWVIFTTIDKTHTARQLSLKKELNDHEGMFISTELNAAIQQQRKQYGWIK